MPPTEVQQPGAAVDLAGQGEVIHLRLAGHDVRVFQESPPLIASMVADLATAKSRAWVESYTISDDAAGRAVAEVLKERARQGVDCRVMYDGIGSAGTPGAFFRGLEEAGVKVHGYRTLRQAFWRWGLLNRRNHRKLLAVDDRVAYFGGMNIVDQSGIRTVGDAKARHLPISAGWRDVHVRLAGPQQAEIAAAFERLWRRVHGELRIRGPRWPIADMLFGNGEKIYFFDCRPRFKVRRPARVLVPLMRGARRSITVSMAYFIPQGRVLRELLRACRRGVQIRVIVPGESDVKVVQWATRHFYDKLLKRGVRIYEREDQMLHSKVMVIDDRWTVIGSCNLDPRSMLINLEFLSVIRARSMAAAVKRICRYEIRNSRRITLADCHRRPWWRRLVDRLAWSFRRWL
ncbi:MAG: phosphatidylserine/phosphatidylglycerophosphate/cardiolipin synthase family protein [Pirellulales bacterium]